MAIKATKRLSVYKKDGFRCVKCKSSNNLTIDHIKPVSQGGNDEESNLQTMCRRCNMRKGDFVVNIWRKIFRLVSIERLHIVRNEMLGAMISKDVILESGLRNHLNQRIENIQPKVETFITEHIKTLEQNALLKVTGLNNTVESFSLRSMERDQHLMNCIKLLCEHVEVLEKKLQ